MCGLEIRVQDGRVDKIRAGRRGRLEPGIHLPQGHHPRRALPRSRSAARPPGQARRRVRRGLVAGSVRRVRTPAPRRDRTSRPRDPDGLHRESHRPQLLAQSLRRRLHGLLAARHDLFERYRRPVAQERLRLPDVRGHVDDPHGRHRPQRLPRDHGSQPARVPGQPGCAHPTSSEEWTRFTSAAERPW